MSLVRVSLFCVLGLTATATAAHAQRTTGAIVGTVIDSSGAVLPGVTVALEGPAVLGKPVTATSTDGVFRFPDLAPTVYSLRFTLAGFSSLQQTGVVVSVG